MLRGLGGLAGLSSLAGCTAEAIPGNDSGEQLRYVQVLPPVSLDPVERDDPWSAQAAAPVFQGLYAYDADLNLVPVVADGHPTVRDGGTTYEVSLTEGVTFQDGSDLTAEDVAYTYEAPVEEETPTLWAVDMIREVRAEDPHTVVFDLEYPYPAFERSLTRAVVPKTVREENTEAFGTEFVVGSGPFKSKVFKEGKYATHKAWDDYWGSQRPGVRQAKFVANHAGLARTTSLKTGQSDVVERVGPKLWKATKKIPSAEVVSTPSYHYHYVGFNTTVEPTANPRVREAVDYLLSMDDLVEHLVAPAGSRQHSPLPDRLAEEWGMPLEEWKGIPHMKNEERAKHILKTEFEKMDVRGWTPNVAVPKHDPLRQKFGASVVKALKSIGFRRARLKKYHWPEFREAILTGDRKKYAMFVGSWAGFPDPDTFLYPLFHENMEGLTNATFYRDEAVMEKIAKARRTRDRSERKPLYEAAITTLLEDRVHLPAFTLDNSFGVKDRVRGFQPHPLAGANPRLVSREGAISLRE